MKRPWVVGSLIFGLGLTILCGVARAQYRPPPAPRQESSSEKSSGEDSFERAVDLKRFRKGNINWDTQELVASGLTALHEEHTQILRELREIKAALKDLEEKR